MTTLDMFSEGWKPRRKEISVEALSEAYDRRTLEDQVGIKVGEE
jgi:hypothetical protein